MIPAKIPAETASLEPTRRSAVWKDWMVVCAVRYEPVSDCNSLIKAVLQGIFREIRGFCTKALVSCAVISKACGANSLEKLAGNFFELAGKQQGMILRKQGICSGVISSREDSSYQLRKTLELFCLSSDTYATLTYQQNRHKLIL